MTMRLFALIAIGVGIVVVIALAIPLVLTQRHLREVRTELARANEQIVQDRAASDQLEQTISNLKAELDAANKARRDADQKTAAEHEARQSQIEALTKAADDAKAKLSEAEKQIAELNDQLATSSAQLKQATADKDTAQSNLSDIQSQLESVNSELATTKEKAQQANAKADDAANMTSTLKDELDQANAQIEQLKSELDQRPLPPVSVSPPLESSPSPQ